MSSITVVICTRNRADRLRRALESLDTQACPRPWEVLVVDNGSEDGTADLVRQRAAEFPAPLRLHVEGQQGLSQARNAALEIADGEVILFIDDDVTCLPGWLAAHAALYERAEVMATAGRILPVLPAETPGWFRDLLPSTVGGPSSRYDFGDEGCRIRPQPERRLPLPFGANMGVRKAVAIEVRGFQTDFGWGRRMIPCEDTEFFLRVEALGAEMHYVAAAALRHHIEAERVSLDYALRWREGYGRAMTLLHSSPRDHPALVRKLLRERRRLGRLARHRRDHADALGEVVAQLDLAELNGRILEARER